MGKGNGACKYHCGEWGSCVNGKYGIGCGEGNYCCKEGYPGCTAAMMAVVSASSESRCVGLKNQGGSGIDKQITVPGGDAPEEMLLESQNDPADYEIKGNGACKYHCGEWGSCVNGKYGIGCGEGNYCCKEGSPGCNAAMM